MVWFMFFQVYITNLSREYPVRVNCQVIDKPVKLNHGDVLCRYMSFRCTSFRFIVLNFVSLRYISFRCVSFLSLVVPAKKRKKFHFKLFLCVRIFDGEKVLTTTPDSSITVVDDIGPVQTREISKMTKKIEFQLLGVKCSKHNCSLCSRDMGDFNTALQTAKCPLWNDPENRTHQPKIQMWICSVLW